jgi:S-formylglutathione hydrolase FrmB
MKNVRNLLRNRVPRVPQALLGVLAASLYLAGCRTAPPPPVGDYPRVASGVRMEEVEFHSSALNRQMPYRVFLPAKLPAGRKFPAVYLLHGNGGSYLNWSNYSDVSKYAGLDASGGAILVMPQGDSSYWVNAALKPEDRYEDYLTRDLIADVEARFPVEPSRKGRAIVGVSMGGYAAIKLALTRPDLFIFAGAISPALDVPSRRFSFRRASQYWRFKTIFGPWGSPTRKSSDPFLLVQSSVPSTTPYLFITAGQQEALADPITRFTKRLQNRGFAYQFQTKPGGHDWTEWDEQIPSCFENLLQHLHPSE